jgi:peroxiredoxin
MTLALGDPAPPLKLSDSSGATVDALAVAADKPLLVAFVCNHCPFVKLIAPRLGELAATWEQAGLQVAGVNPNEGRHPGDAADRMPGFAAANGWTFAYLVDSDQMVAHAYGASCTPEFFLFDKAHLLRYHGRFDASRPSLEVPVDGADLAAAVTAVLAGREPDGEQLPTAGCAIKWDREPD